jgi:hypothetical protein
MPNLHDFRMEIVRTLLSTQNMWNVITFCCLPSLRWGGQLRKPYASNLWLFFAPNFFRSVKYIVYYNSCVWTWVAFPFNWTLLIYPSQWFYHKDWIFFTNAHGIAFQMKTIQPHLKLQGPRKTIVFQMFSTG